MGNGGAAAAVQRATCTRRGWNCVPSANVLKPWPPAPEEGLSSGNGVTAKVLSQARLQEGGRAQQVLVRRPCGGRHTKESRGTTEAEVGATGLHTKGRLEEAGGTPPLLGR